MAFVKNVKKCKNYNNTKKCGLNGNKSILQIFMKILTDMWCHTETRNENRIEKKEEILENPYWKKGEAKELLEYCKQEIGENIVESYFQWF